MVYNSQSGSQSVSQSVSEGVDMRSLADADLSSDDAGDVPATIGPLASDTSGVAVPATCSDSSEGHFSTNYYYYYYYHYHYHYHYYC